MVKKGRKKFDLNKEIMKEEDKEKVLEKVEDTLEKERTRKLSIKEGSYSSVMSGMTSEYVTPFALALNASNSQIGFLSSFAGIISPIAQIFGSKLIEKYSRKAIIVLFVTLQALMWLPVALLALFFWRGILTEYLPFFLIGFYGIYAIFGALAGPAWFSLMGDLVPDGIRGKYFSGRNKVASIVVMASAITASFILDYFKTKGLVLLGFATLFIIATIFRLLSANLFRKHYEPQLKLNDGYYFSFWQFVKKAPSNNFGRFVIFVAIFYFAVYLASPFFAVYMLKDLGFSYKTLMLVNLSATFFSIIFMSAWGKFADQYGNKKLLKLGAILIGLMPILWILSPSPIYLFLVPQLVSGIGWAAFNLAASNFIYDAVTRERRAICVAYYNMLIGIGIFLGAGIGGILAQHLTISFMSTLLFIFLISGVARLLASFMLAKVKEPRNVAEVKESFIFYFKGIRPVFDELYYDFYNGIRGLNKLGKEMM